MPGSIPACTGKPRGGSFVPVTQSVYPRMYGETVRYRSAVSRIDGLSPHVRGNLSGGYAKSVECGSIPACTGKPRGPGIGNNLATVYPRMYGETYRIV